MRIGIIALGIFGLFAQLFNGVLILGVFIGSLASILLGSLPSRNSNTQTKLFLIVAIIGGGIYDAVSYYLTDQVQGNYYGGCLWSLPSAILALFIYKRSISSVPSKNL